MNSTILSWKEGYSGKRSISFNRNSFISTIRTSKGGGGGGFGDCKKNH